jgi:hypothetical protein
MALPASPPKICDGSTLHAAPVPPMLRLPYAQAGILRHAIGTAVPIARQTAGRDATCSGAGIRTAPDCLTSWVGTWRTLDTLRALRPVGSLKSGSPSPPSRTSRPFASPHRTACEGHEHEDQSKPRHESDTRPVHGVPPFLINDNLSLQIVALLASRSPDRGVPFVGGQQASEVLPSKVVQVRETNEPLRCASAA